MLTLISMSVRVSSKFQQPGNGSVQWNTTSLGDVCTVVGCVLAWYAESGGRDQRPTETLHMNLTDYNMTLDPYGRFVLELPPKFYPLQSSRGLHSISTCIWFDNHFTRCDMVTASSRFLRDTSGVEITTPWDMCKSNPTRTPLKPRGTP